MNTMDSNSAVMQNNASSINALEVPYADIVKQVESLEEQPPESNQEQEATKVEKVSVTTIEEQSPKGTPISTTATKTDGKVEEKKVKSGEGIDIMEEIKPGSIKSEADLLRMQKSLQADYTKKTSLAAQIMREQEHKQRQNDTERVRLQQVERKQKQWHQEYEQYQPKMKKAEQDAKVLESHAIFFNTNPDVAQFLDRYIQWKGNDRNKNLNDFFELSTGLGAGLDYDYSGNRTKPNPESEQDKSQQQQSPFDKEILEDYAERKLEKDLSRLKKTSGWDFDDKITYKILETATNKNMTLDAAFGEVERDYLRNQVRNKQPHGNTKTAQQQKKSKEMSELEMQERINEEIKKRATALKIPNPLVGNVPGSAPIAYGKEGYDPRKAGSLDEIKNHILLNDIT